MKFIIINIYNNNTMIKYFGCHIMISYGLYSTINRIQELGGTAYQIFLRNPKSTNVTMLSDSKRKELMKMKDFFESNPNIKCIVHSPYVLNFCHSPDSDQYSKSVNVLINDLKDAEIGGIEYCIIHLGKNTNKLSFDEAMDNYATGIVECLNKTKGLNSKIVIETGAGQGTEVGWKLKNLGKIRDIIYSKLDDKKDIERVKYCIDTCHITSASYDIINECDKVVSLIEKYIKWENVVCMHVNDNKTPVGSFVDRHADIGYGTLGEKVLETFLRKALTYNENIICILETPGDDSDIQTQLEWLSKVK